MFLETTVVFVLYFWIPEVIYGWRKHPKDQTPEPPMVFNLRIFIYLWKKTRCETYATFDDLQGKSDDHRSYFMVKDHGILKIPQEKEVKQQW